MYPVVILMSFLYSTHVHGDNYLISHPFYSGSHVLTLHHVAEALVSRGHKVCIISIIWFNYNLHHNIHYHIQLWFTCFANWNLIIFHEQWLLFHTHTQVVTVRFQDTHEFKLKNLGSNHREIVLALKNEDGNLPFVTKEVEGKFGMPVELLWEEGLSLSTIFKVSNAWSVVQAYCHQVLSNVTLHNELKSEHFDVTIGKNMPETSRTTLH